MHPSVKHYSLMKRLPADTISDHVDSPVGRLTLIASQAGIHALLWEHFWMDAGYQRFAEMIPQSSTHKQTLRAKKQLFEYFSGMRVEFSVPVVMDGTDFQKQAWTELLKIPYGSTISYEEHAIQLGNKDKVRASANATARNPIPILIPCHRVRAKNGSLGGFSGGQEAKHFLIQLEKQRAKGKDKSLDSSALA